MSINISPQGFKRYVHVNLGGDQRRKFRVLAIAENSYLGGLDISSGTLNVSDVGCHCVHVGKYSSLGSRLHMILDMNHDYHSLYQGLIPEFADGKGGRAGGMQILERIARRGQILIGNDVWIGDGVTMLGGVRIGDGAVVAAESVVVKDVPPYAVVGGNPAKILKYRFPEEVIRSLRRIAWWNWSSGEIAARKADMQGAVAEFARKYDCQVANYPKKGGLFVQRLAVEKVPLLVYFMDFDDNYPVYPGVLAAFLKRFCENNGELLLCYDAYDETSREKMEEIAGLLCHHQDIRALIQIQGVSREEEEGMISEADILITNRDCRTLERVEYADRYGVVVCSGVDIPVFGSVDIRTYGKEKFFVR